MKYNRKGNKGMKRIFLVLALLLGMLSPVADLSAQIGTVYPVDINVMMTPPFGPCLKDYVGTSRFQCHLLLRDMNRNSYRMAVKLTVKSMTGKLMFGAMSNPFFLTPGQPNMDMGESLFAEFFSQSGAGIYARYGSGCMPEGAYNFIYQVVDANDSRYIPVSRECVLTNFIDRGASPQLITPLDGDSLCLSDGQTLNFTWQLPFVTGEANCYKFELCPVPEGMSPNLAMESGIAMQGYYSAMTYMPMHMVKKSATMPFSPKTTYAWRVTLYDGTGQNPRSSYPNGGASSVFTFVNCGEKQVPDPYVRSQIPAFKEIAELDTVHMDTVTVMDGRAEASWLLDDEPVRNKYAGYVVEVRKRSQDTWSPYSMVGVEDITYDITGLKYNEHYQVRAQYYLVGGDGNPIYAPYSDTLDFVVPNPADTVECGELAGLTDCAADEKGRVLKIGDSFSANGTRIYIDSIGYNATDSAVISGTGYVNFPVLSNFKLKMRFAEVRINCAGEMAQGRVASVYDESTGAIIDLNRISGKGDGGGSESPTTETSVTKYDSRETALQKTSEGGFFEVDGSVYVKDADGQAVEVGKPLVLGAADYTNPNVLDDGNAYIRFRNGDPRRIAFDDDEHNVYRKPHSIGADYVYFGNDDTPGSGYIVPWLAMNPGRVVQLPAVPSKGMAGYTDVKFVLPTSDGNYLELNHTKTADGYLVTLPGKDAGTITEVYAIGRKGGQTAYSNVGKLRISNYERRTQHLVLVPVTDGYDNVDVEKIQAYLDEVYGRLGVTWKVTKEARFYDENVENLLSDGFDLTTGGLFGKESDDMLLLRKLYFEGKEVADNTAYIFLLDKATDATGNLVAGDMPQNRPVGYVFMDHVAGGLDRLLTHELAHGVYNLDHTFEKAYGMAKGTTDNLMDYAASDPDFLAYYQWNLIDNPGFAWSLLEKDEDAMYKSWTVLFGNIVENIPEHEHEVKSFVSIAGKIVTLPANARDFSFMDGYLVGFTIEDERWAAFTTSQTHFSGFYKDAEKKGDKSFEISKKAKPYTMSTNANSVYYALQKGGDCLSIDVYKVDFASSIVSGNGGVGAESKLFRETRCAIDKLPIMEGASVKKVKTVSNVINCLEGRAKELYKFVIEHTSNGVELTDEYKEELGSCLMLFDSVFIDQLDGDSKTLTGSVYTVNFKEMFNYGHLNLLAKIKEITQSFITRNGILVVTMEDSERFRDKCLLYNTIKQVALDGDCVVAESIVEYINKEGSVDLCDWKFMKLCSQGAYEILNGHESFELLSCLLKNIKIPESFWNPNRFDSSIKKLNDEIESVLKKNEVNPDSYVAMIPREVSEHALACGCGGWNSVVDLALGLTDLGGALTTNPIDMYDFIKTTYDGLSQDGALASVSTEIMDGIKAHHGYVEGYGFDTYQSSYSACYDLVFVASFYVGAGEVAAISKAGSVSEAAKVLGNVIKAMPSKSVKSVKAAANTVKTLPKNAYVVLKTTPEVIAKISEISDEAVKRIVVDIADRVPDGVLKYLSEEAKIVILDAYLETRIIEISDDGMKLLNKVNVGTGQISQINIIYESSSVVTDVSGEKGILKIGKNVEGKLITWLDANTLKRWADVCERLNLGEGKADAFLAKLNQLSDKGNALYNDFAKASDDLLRNLIDKPELVDAWKRLSDCSASEAVRTNTKALEALSKKLAGETTGFPTPIEIWGKAFFDEHLLRFNEGVSCLKLNSTRKYNTLGNSELFVIPKSEMDKLLLKTNGDISLIEKELGIPEGAWKDEIAKSKDKLIRVDIIDKTLIKNLRMSSGMEGSANNLWIPGGKTPEGWSEAVIESVEWSKISNDNIKTIIE
ncbi:MAG: fibronectin type III domain-containing protein [Prevotellaceae bacterium]|nr:fibronectin type III domain-containing protein [Prevotellaceae bacterium]